MTDTLTTYDRIPDATVESIAKGGRSYPHEARNMARELLQLRAKTPPADPGTSNPYTRGGP